MLRALLICGFFLIGSPALSGDLFASRTLRVGTILESGDLRVPEDSDSLGNMEAMLGLEVRRAIYAGRRIAPRDLGPPTLIRRNDVVTVTYQSGSLGLRTQGRALGAGGLGEVVEVINLDTRLKVRARVIGSLAVEVSR